MKMPASNVANGLSKYTVLRSHIFGSAITSITHVLVSTGRFCLATDQAVWLANLTTPFFFLFRLLPRYFAENHHSPQSQVAQLVFYLLNRTPVCSLGFFMVITY